MVAASGRGHGPAGEALSCLPRCLPMKQRLERVALRAATSNGASLRFTENANRRSGTTVRAYHARIGLAR